MEIRTLTGIDLNELLDTFNESFSDYLVPLQLTSAQLEGKIKADKIDFNYSVGAFTGNRLAAFILHGFDITGNKKMIYNAGTGVIPQYRNQGLAKQMYDFMLPSLRTGGISTLSLEVITQNIPAIRSYERVGFKTTRKLVCYKGAIHTAGNEGTAIREMQRYDWQAMGKFWDFSPSWQNSARVLEALTATNKSYGAFIDDQLVGYIVYNPPGKRIQQFGVDKPYRRKKIASALFDHISEPGNSVSIINVEESATATNRFLTGIGLKNFAEQFEMKLELD